MSDFALILTSTLTTTAVISLALFLFKNTITSGIQHLFDRSLAEYTEKLHWGSKVREQSSIIAEYLSIAPFLKESSDPEMFNRANKLSYEMALWLDAEVYKKATLGIAKMM